MKIKTRKQDKKLQEALDLVKELQIQNEELIKYNQELVSRMNNN